jgi:hypothetical protein
MCGKEVQNNNATPICFVMAERERERERERNWTYECGLKNRGFWRVLFVNFLKSHSLDKFQS